MVRLLQQVVAPRTLEPLVHTPGASPREPVLVGRDEWRVGLWRSQPAFQPALPRQTKALRTVALRKRPSLRRQRSLPKPRQWTTDSLSGCPATRRRGEPFRVAFLLRTAAAAVGGLLLHPEADPDSRPAFDWMWQPRLRILCVVVGGQWASVAAAAAPADSCCLVAGRRAPILLRPPASTTTKH